MSVRLLVKDQLEVIDGYVKSAIEDGADNFSWRKDCRVEGFENGYWYEPTVIADVNHDMKVVKEEIFGPVVVIMKFKDEKEVIKLANDTELWFRLSDLDKRSSACNTSCRTNYKQGLSWSTAHSPHSRNTVWWL